MPSACDICGCTQTNLVDGFYYCTECGTQDVNVQETLVEIKSLAEGIVALGARKRIRQIPQAKVEMTDDWYRWHSLNFLLQGLANELVELGAAPSFKTKLLWVWTRYMKIYQNKADFGLSEMNENDEHKTDENVENEEMMSKNEFCSEEEDDIEDLRKFKKNNYKPDIKKMNMPLLVTFLYVALNLDQSHIQLTHLIRFIKEGRLPLTHWQKYVPKELKPKKLHYSLLFNKSWFIHSYSTTLLLAMQLFKKLDLGDPIVPDLRLLVDEYMQELCLPNDMKPVVLSLMHFRSFDYLDMNVKFYETGRIPSYELYVISHILCAMKICFGLDDEYEFKLSDAAEKINEVENHPKSFNSEPTERLFSFREWCNYIQFRKSLLWSHSLYLGAPNYLDMDDYVAFEHMSDKPDFKKTFRDEISRDIINKLPNVDLNVIPKSEFPVTTTPHTTYTRVIIDHQQDPTVKQLLSEDFTQYSLKYITQDMFLVDLDSTNPENIVSGVNRKHINEYRDSFDAYKDFAKTKFSKKMVYVRDCDNHNWMITQRPKLEHITVEKANSEEYENESDSVESEKGSSVTGELDDRASTIDINDDSKAYESDSKETSVITDDSKVLDDLNNIIDMEIDKNKRVDDDLLNIPEEDENENIFDDKFEDIDVKKEDGKELECDQIDEPPPNIRENDEPCEVFQIRDKFRHDPNYQEYRQDKDSDESSQDSIHLNPETLNRADATKELVIHACNKYRISLPGQYIVQPRKKTVRQGKFEPNVPRARVLGLITEKINGFVAEYHNKIKEDVLLQMSTMVQSAITDCKARNEETLMDEEPPDNIDNTLDLDEHNNMQTLNDTTQDPAHTDAIAENSKYELFDEDSDGETQKEDLLPKKNVKFDEATHDISQLYIKTAEDTSAPEIELNPNLYKIIDEKIKDEKENKPPSSPEGKEDSNSEDEMSLSMLQQLKLLREQLTKQAQLTKEKKLKPLIKSPIPTYNYWVRHYKEILGNQLQKRFATELENVFPTAFKIVMYECADVIGYHPFFLYESLQRVERCIKNKYGSKKRFVPSYFEKERNRIKRSKHML